MLKNIVADGKFISGWAEVVREIVSAVYPECPIIYTNRTVKKAFSRKDSAPYLNISAKCKFSSLIINLQCLEMYK